MTFNSWSKQLLAVLLFSLAKTAADQTPPSVEVVLDLLDAFQPALAHDVLSCEVRRPGSADGVKKNALFEHPRPGEKPARVEYEIALPSVESGERLLLAFDLALSDGIDFNKPGSSVDGVHFVVEVDGQRLFAQACKETHWRACAVDLNSFAGKTIKLTFIVEALRTTNFDWALWGNPRLLHFRGSQLQEPGRTNTAVGALALGYRPGKNFKVELRPSGEGSPFVWQEPANPPNRDEVQWLAVDLNFPKAQAVEVVCEPKEALTQIHLAPYLPQPRLVRVAATRAVPLVGETLQLRVDVKNEGRGRLEVGATQVELKAGNTALIARNVPALAPGESWQSEWKWPTPAKPGRVALSAQLKLATATSAKVATNFVEIFPARKADAMVQNQHLRIEVFTASAHSGYARIFRRHDHQWISVGVWQPLMRVVLDTAQGGVNWTMPLKRSQSQKASALSGETLVLQTRNNTRDFEGVVWTALLQITLDPAHPVARLHYEWTANKERKVKALWGPNLYVGEGTTGSAKSWGLFPGLEYLYGGERSSNPRDFAPPLDDRRTPHPDKITLPLMAITFDPDSQAAPSDATRFFTTDSLKDLASAPVPKSKKQFANQRSTLALTWDPLQKWDGQHLFPSARFTSPNFDEGMDNHRLGLFLPSCPDFVAENSDRAQNPYVLEAGRKITLEANLTVTDGPILSALGEWYREMGGIPKPNPWPRSFEEELAVCRAGFLQTVWDQPSEKWRHCIDWATSHAPGFAALLWMDAHVTQNPEGRRQSSERVELAARNMLRDGGAGLFTSQANCHIMRWEFPFLYGYLAEALPALEGSVKHLIASQQPNGTWRYQPGNAQQADLGQAGDSVLGTCAHNAANLLRFARIAGDRAALDAGEKALHLMERFRVPRGGQTWECPMYEPDILAAAWAIAAYLDGFRITGNARWLHDAVYWAESGLPFMYHWTLPDRPMMLGATIPVFGSTFYTHTWLAVPVQWCGLVYSYHVHHLAEELEKRSKAEGQVSNAKEKSGSPLPVALNFSPGDWKRVVEHITVSAMHQQFADGPRLGAYPDSISNFQKKNGAFLNPEDILVNVLTLEGYDPDIQTARLRTANQNIVISSGAHIDQAKATAGGVNFRLRFFPGEPSHSLVTGLQPQEVRVNGQPLPRSETPVRREPGWWWDQQRQRLFLIARHDREFVQVTLVEKR